MTYDESGNMLTQEDKINDVTYSYSYDDDGNQTAIKSSKGFNIAYSSTNTTTDNLLTETGKTIFTDNDIEKIMSYTATYNEEKEKISTTIVLISGGQVKYVAKGEDNSETTTVTNNNGDIVLLMKIIENEDGSKIVTDQNNNSIVYTYDKNNNITKIVENDVETVSYEYDGLQQLIRENNCISNQTILYAYDNGGNILSKTIYEYTVGSVASEPIDTQIYEYNNSEWTDLLTSYNGEEITYDEIGNPIQYRDGMEFTWKYGRSLSTIVTNDGASISYEYNSEGVRTSKTVNGIITNYIVDGYDIIKEETEENTII